LVSPSAAPAERHQGLRSRSLTSRAAWALTSVGMCRVGHDGVHAYASLPSEEASKVAGDPAAADEALPSEGAAEEAEDRRHDGSSTPPTVVAASFEDAASATSSWTAQWCAGPAPSLPPALDLDPAILPGSGQPVEVPSLSHPALLYPEQENTALPLLPQETTTEETCDHDTGTPTARDIPEVTGFVRARVDEFHEKMEKKKAAVVDADEAPDFFGAGDDLTPPPRFRPPPRAGKPVVLYFTSLRSVRRTFEDCRAVRAILRCYRVRLDERDVSMHAAFKSELRELLLLAGGGEEGAALPRVFVGGRHDLGGAEDVRALHEAGELARALAGCDAAPAAAAGRSGHVGACAACGEARFVPCGTCHGSRKVFVDDEGCRFAGFFRQCPDCNENGLIRCPVCCY
jgi:glutaredoxin domain-containing cysteine-rich protein 1